MSPFDIIKDWSNCTDVDVFMDHVLAATSKESSATDQKLQKVAKNYFDDFDDKVCKTFEAITQYLRKYRLNIESSATSFAQRLECLEELINKIEMISIFAGSETAVMKRARTNAEKMIYQLENDLSTNNLEDIIFGLKLKGIPSQQLKLISSQYHHIPFIQSLVNELINHYNDENIKRENEGIPAGKPASNNEKTKILLQNLSQFTQLMETLLNEEKHINTTALAHLTRESMKSISAAQAYLTGEQALTKKEEIAEIKNQISQFIENMFSPDALKEKRAHSPITNTAIRKQAQLHESIRQATPWTAQQKKLDPLNVSVNKVFKLRNADGSQAVAYYKESSNKGKNAELMEELMWDSALVMKYEELFVPTAAIPLRTKKNLRADGYAKGYKVKTWDAQGKLIEKTARGARHGGFQPAQEGVTLSDYRTDPNPNKIPINRVQLDKAIFANALFGFFDAHSDNILIDPKGNIKFFDNACSMPHSNGTILWGNVILRSSFRSGLLALSDTQTPLTPQDRNFFNSEIQKCKALYDKLVHFYNDTSTQSKINKLPKDWFHTNEILEAMQERIQRMEVAANDPNIKTLCDFILASQPNLRFTHVMTYISLVINDLPYQQANKDYLYFMDSIGYHPIDKCVYKCSTRGIDPQFVKQLCDDPNLSFDEIIARITTDSTRIPITIALEHADQIVDELNKASKTDFKDL